MPRPPRTIERRRCECRECGCLDDAKRDDNVCASCARSCKTEPCPSCSANQAITRRDVATDTPCVACRKAARRALVDDVTARLVNAGKVAPPAPPRDTVTTPGGWEDRAIAAETAGRWADAAAYWTSAAGATLGHNRADRYQAHAARCRANVDPLTTSTPTARPDRPTVLAKTGAGPWHRVPRT